MMFKEYVRYDAMGMAELIRKKEITAGEVLEAAIDRIEKVNPSINAVILKMYDEGKRRLTHLDMTSPLAGVPFLLKDLNLAYKGVLLQNGSRAFHNYIPDFDSTIVTRYNRTGLITIGKTNTPEFGLMGITEPEAWVLLEIPGILSIHLEAQAGRALQP